MSARRFFRMLLCLLALPLGLGSAVAASATEGGAMMPGQAAPLPRVALVLSGGGARGLAHIGVLKALDEMRVPVGCVVGTSMGGIVGASFSSGMSTPDIEKAALGIDWAAAFQDRPDRDALKLQRKRNENGHLMRPEFGFRNGEIILPGGVIYGQQLSVLFSLFTRRSEGVTDFSRLPLPFKAIATDIETGQPVVLERGVLPLAMRATMSVPGVMAPVEIDGRALLDGGLVDNLPVSTGRALCGDTVIAVNLGTPLLKREDTHTAVGVGWQMINILTEQNVQASLKSLRSEDILISPDLTGLNFGSFEATAELIRRGYAATQALAGKLQQHAVSTEQYAAWNALRERRDQRLFFIDEIRIAPTRWINRDALAARMRLQPGLITDDEFMAAIAEAHGSGDFEQVRLNLQREGERRVAVIEPVEKSWGPHYLRFGISLNSQTGEASSFDAVVSSHQTWLNPLGGEWRNIFQIGQHAGFLSEFYQPLGAGSSWFLSPRIGGVDESLPIYSGDAQVQRMNRKRLYGGLDLGYELDRYGEFRVGAARGRESYKGEIGTVSGSWDWIPAAVWQARLDLDQLDNANFPTRGGKLRAEFTQSAPDLGAEVGFLKRSIELLGVKTLNANAWSLALAHADVDKSAGLLDRIAVGGPNRLSAYPIGRFRADEVDYARLGYQRVIDPPLGLKLGGLLHTMYIGSQIETARIRQSADAATPADGVYRAFSVHLAAETLLGPATLGFAIGDDYQRAIWLAIGVPWSPR